MDWLLEGPLPVAALGGLIDSYVPRFEGRQFAALSPVTKGNLFSSLVALSPNTVLYCEGANDLWTWNADTHERVWIGQSQSLSVCQLVAISEHRFLCVEYVRRHHPKWVIKLWDVRSKTHRLVQIPNSAPELFARLVDTPDIAISYSDGSIRVWNADSERHRILVPSPQTWWEYLRSMVSQPPMVRDDKWNCLAALPEGRLAAGSRTGRVCVFDAVLGTQLHHCQVGEWIWTMTWCMQSASLLISANCGVLEWNLTQVTATPYPSSPSRGNSLLMLEDGTVVTPLLGEAFRTAVLVQCHGSNVRELASGYFAEVVQVGHCRLMAAGIHLVAFQ
jgi:WD40 repeat protein